MSRPNRSAKGRLSGFKYREIAQRIKKLGFQFDRQAADSHETWLNPSMSRYTTIPNHSGDKFRAIVKQAEVSPDEFPDISPS
ncbi:MAG: type II toxin-antitoxin system HicA family toxin [Bdellovibrionales bacterium]|nr:type II toxin-antitoxin system HicA family toxin [Bdellovibrionales bacterium]